MGAPDLLANLAAIGVTVAAQGSNLIVQPWSRVPEDMRLALRAAKPELLAMLTPPPARPYRLTAAEMRAHMPTRGVTPLAPDLRPARAISSDWATATKTPRIWPSDCTCATCTPTTGTCAPSAGTTAPDGAATVKRPDCSLPRSAAAWRLCFSIAAASCRLKERNEDATQSPTP